MICGLLPDVCWWDQLGAWWASVLTIFRSLYIIWPALLISHAVAYLIGWRFGWKGLLVVLTLGVGLLLIRGNKPAPEPQWDNGGDEPVPQPRKRRTLRDIFRR